MKPIIKPWVMLWMALLTGMLSYSQAKSIDSTDVKKGVQMDIQSKNKTTVHKLYEEILNTGKLELLSQIIAVGYIGPRDIKGAAGFAETIRPVLLAFPDIKWTIEDLIAEGDKVVARWVWTGTNTGSFAGFPPSNKQVTHHAISIFQFNGDKIIKGWMIADRLSFFQQIGVISPDITTPPNKQ